MNQLIHQQAGELFPREWQDEKLQSSCEAKLEVRLFCNLKLRNQRFIKNNNNNNKTGDTQQQKKQIERKGIEKNHTPFFSSTF